MRRARACGMIDDAATEPTDAVRGSDLVVLATPVGAIPGLMKRMQGKSCFNFTSVDEAAFAELAQLTRRGFDRFHQERANFL